MITEKRELKNVPLADLVPYARNPRKNDPAVQRVAASLKEYGLVKNSIVVDEDMVLITGHTTMKAMQALKWATAPEVTQVFGLTEAQKKAYRIADNKLGELAAWDDELLALELDDLKVLDFDLDLTGFDTKELAKILDAEKEATDDDFEPPATVETDIQRQNMIGITREEAFRKFMDYTHWRTDARLVREYIWKSADTIEWLQDMGVEFLGAYKYSPDSEATWHIVKSESGMGPRAAGALIKTLTKRAEELDVTILLETPAKKLEKNEDGQICGVWATDVNGEEVYVDCCAVVIATGGFGDNPEMIKELTPYEWGKNMYSFRIPGTVGDGIKMAWEVGAGRTETNMEVSYSTPSKVEYSCLHRVHTQPNLLVNLQGERFVNEEIMANTTYGSNALSTQHKMLGFMIIDDSIKNHYRRHGLPNISLVSPNAQAKDYDDDVKKALETGDPWFYMADSIEELADKMGVNKENLVKTVENQQLLRNP